MEHSEKADIILQNQKESAEQGLEEQKFILSSREGKSEEELEMGLQER